MKRRDLIKTATLGGLAGCFSSSLLGRLAYAQTLSAKAPNLVVIRINGAMDTLQGLNPWLLDRPAETDLHTAYDPALSGAVGDNKSVLRKVAGTQISLAPSAHALSPFATRMAVINGIWMGPTDLGHPYAMQYSSSGRVQEKAPHLSALIANERRLKNEFLIINGPVEKGSLRLKIMQTINLNQGLEIPDPEVTYLMSAYKSAEAHASNFSALIKKKDSVEKFNHILKELNPKAFTEQTGSNKEPLKDEDAIVAGLASGISSVAQIDWEVDAGGNIDNHFDYDNLHPKAVQIRWERLAQFLKNLDRYSLLKKTLVVVVSEFSRTPALNGNGGKDHNYHDNSSLFIGYGVNGGTVAGSHRLFGAGTDREKSQLSGEFIDFGVNGEVGSGEIFRTNEKPQDTDLEKIPAGVDLIRPANVMATASEILIPGSSKLFGEATRVVPHIIKI